MGYGDLSNKTWFLASLGSKSLLIEDKKSLRESSSLQALMTS